MSGFPKPAGGRRDEMVAWFGDASTAAHGKAEGDTTSMVEVAARLDAGILFHKKAFDAVRDAKAEITTSTYEAQDAIDKLDSTKKDDAQKIEDKVNGTLMSNVNRAEQAFHQVAALTSAHRRISEIQKRSAAPRRNRDYENRP